MASEQWIESRVAGCLRDVELKVTDSAPEDWRDLVPDAVAQYNLTTGADYDTLAGSVLEKAVVAQIRHEFTTYQWALDTVQQRLGAVKAAEVERRAYARVRVGIQQAIAVRYPDLASAATAAAVQSYGSRRRSGPY
jgi:hypothetical protein